MVHGKVIVISSMLMTNVVDKFAMLVTSATHHIEMWPILYRPMSLCVTDISHRYRHSFFFAQFRNLFLDKNNANQGRYYHMPCSSMVAK